jgi:hypothetical protein
VFLTGLTIGAKIANLKEILREIIEPDIILLNSLVTEGVLAIERRDKIWICETVHDKADELLRWLEIYSGEDVNVVKAFKNGEQEHIANYISANGGIFILFI